MPFDRKYIQQGYENRAAWPDINSQDPSRWGQMVVWSAFKDAFGREPTDEELARYSSQASQVPDQVRQQIMSLPTQQAALSQLGQGIVKGQQAQADIFQRGQQQQGNIFGDVLGQQKTLFEQQQQTLQDILQKQRQGALDYYTTGAGAQQLKGAYNNLGLLNSGAFNEGLASRLGDVERGIQEELVGGFAVPSLRRQQQIPMQSGLIRSMLGRQGTGVQSQLGLQGLGYELYPQEQELQLPTQLQQRTFEGMDFNQMARLYQQLQQQMQPSWWQQAAPLFQGGLGAGGAIGAAALLA